MKECITKTRETMLDKVIEKYGFEHSVTITFAVLCEDKRNKQEWIAELYETLMN